MCHSNSLPVPRHRNNPCILLFVRRAGRLLLFRLALGEAPGHGEEALPQVQCRALVPPRLHALGLLLLEPAHCTFDILPGFHARNKHKHADNGRRPLPGDSLVLEHVRVQAGDVHSGEDGEEGDGDRPEQELILPDVREEGERPCVVRIDPEHTSSHGLEFPGRDQDQPGEFGKYGRTCTEHDIARLVVLAVAVLTQSVGTGTVDDEDKRHQAARALDGAIHQHVRDQFPGEDALPVVMRWTLHDIRRGFFTAEAKCGKRRREHVDPQNLERREREHTESRLILESQSTDEQDDLADVGGEQVQDESLDVVEHSTSFFDRIDDTRKIVVRQHNIGCRFRDVTTVETHCNTHVRELE